MSFFDSLIKEAGNKYASRVSEGNDSDVESYISTGSYSLNALLSGSIYGGLPGNKITALAGESSTGKTFYALNVVREFLNNNSEGAVFYFESESAITTDMLVDRGIDIDRVYIIPVATIQEFRTQVVKILDKYLETPEKDRKPMFMVLDSLGMLSTEKEVADMAAGEDKRDMTRAQLIRGSFRVLTLKLGRAKVPMLLTNHTYQVVGSYVPTRDMGGGEGLKYAASTIIFLSKKKDKEGTDVVGNIITARLQKSRMTIENKKVETLLNYQEGLNPYYGLLEIAEKYEIIKKVSTRYEMPDGTKVFEKAINEQPEKYFTKDVLDKIDEACKKEFLYGSANKMDTTDDRQDSELESEA
jgi:RecA/RadA recombinase